MPKQVLALNHPGDLVLEWKGMFKMMSVRYNGTELGIVSDKRALEHGASFALPDGRNLRVQFVRKFGGPGLEVTCDGVPVKGSHGDPEVQIKAAYGVLFFIAALNVALGLAAELGKVGFLLRIGIGWPSLGFGLLFGVFAVLVWKVRSQVALIIAIVLFAADGIISIVAAMAMVGAGSSPPMGGIIMRIFLLIPMITGVRALGQAKRQS